tara:strand:- start:6193 stop:6456 length:264 start_codon:yes stop_codon:yes gene_type:complete
VIFTKQELKKLLSDACHDSIISPSVTYGLLIQILTWDDDDPRDINLDDIDHLADFIAAHADSFLSELEKVIKKQSYDEQNNQSEAYN